VGILDLANFRPSIMARRRVEKRRFAYYCKVELCALFAVCLVILVQFMVSSEPGHQMSIDLATSRQARLLHGAIREDALRIAVTRDGKVYFGSGRVATETLPIEIRNGLDAGSEKRIYLLVDARARYSDVKPALDQIRLAGVENVSFLTQSAPPQ
jgi:biopolymer transport protein TolR